MAGTSAIGVLSRGRVGSGDSARSNAGAATRGESMVTGAVLVFFRRLSWGGKACTVFFGHIFIVSTSRQSRHCESRHIPVRSLAIADEFCKPRAIFNKS